MAIRLFFSVMQLSSRQQPAASTPHEPGSGPSPSPSQSSERVDRMDGRCPKFSRGPRFRYGIWTEERKPVMGFWKTRLWPMGVSSLLQTYIPAPLFCLLIGAVFIVRACKFLLSTTVVFDFLSLRLYKILQLPRPIQVSKSSFSLFFLLHLNYSEPIRFPPSWLIVNCLIVCQPLIRTVLVHWWLTFIGNWIGIIQSN